MTARFLTTFAIATIFAQQTSAQTKPPCAEKDPYYWQGDRRLAVYDKLMPLMTCTDHGADENAASADSTACNWFVNRALQAGFGVSDFMPAGGKWKSANEIAASLASSPNWEFLGKASEQSALNAAAQAASTGRPVLAAMTGAPHGHVAIVLGGPVRQSGQWALAVPNSASFLLGRPDQAYVGCMLSYAFRPEYKDDVKLYRRKP